MFSTIFALILIAQTPQTIWVDTTDIYNAKLTSQVIPVVAFYDQNGKLRMLMTISGPTPPSPSPNPTPPVPPGPVPVPPAGTYGITLPLANTIKTALAQNKITKDQVSALANNAYATTASAVNSSIAAGTPMSKADTQNMMVNKTHTVLGATVSPEWAAILDTIVAQMKVLGTKLKGAKELADFYSEVALGLQYGASL